MSLSFGQPSYVNSLGRVSFVARRQAQLCLQLCGDRDHDEARGEGRRAGLDLQWFVVCDERGTPVADFWETSEGIVVFRAASTEIVGQVTEERFVCNDLALWTAVAAAHDAPRGLELAAESSECEDDDPLERSSVRQVAAAGEGGARPASRARRFA